MLQTRLIGNLIFQSCCCPGRMVDRRATGPAGSAFVVLPQPDCELVQVQEPRGLLIVRKVFGVELGDKLGLIGGHFRFSVPELSGR